MRAVFAGLALALALALATPICAEDEGETPPRRVIIVLDRGVAAQNAARTEAGNALRIWRSLEAQGVDARLLACGTDAGERTRLEDAPPTRAGLAGLAKNPLFAFAGPTDPRAVLDHVLAAGDEGPVDIVLLGPFGPDTDITNSPFKKTVARWTKKATEGSRIFPVGPSPEVAALLSGAAGLVPSGRLIVGFGKPVVTTQPFSPLGAGPAPIKAQIRIVADVLDVGTALTNIAVLAPSSDVTEDEITTEANAGLHTFVLLRRGVDGRTATLTFHRSANDDTHWLIPPPQPLTFRWESLTNEARLSGTEGKPATAYTAVDVEAGTPYVATYRLRRTRVGPAPAWRVAAAQGDLPEGLTVEVGPEVKVTPEIGESTVRVRFAAHAGKPVRAQGAITLSAEGVAELLVLPFEVRVAPGKAALKAEVQLAALPRAKDDALSALRIVPENGNVPPAVRLIAACDGGQERWLRAHLISEEGNVTTWPLTETFLLPVNAPRRVAFELDEGTPTDLPWPCTVTIRAEAVPGVQTSGEASITVRRRQPRLALGGPPPTFRLEEGTLTSDQPLILRLDADGGDGAWLLALLATSPAVQSRGEAPIGWQAVGHGSGVWHLVPVGAWTGRQPGLFEASEVFVDLDILWEAGRTPGRIAVPVQIPPRWGTRGFMILALALMALLLALLILIWMRTPSVVGTLLYTVEGLEGTVGRLDLAAVGRRVRAITADATGKLTVAGSGTAIGKVRPTRVGGMLEYVDPSGSKERRLLVDGVSLRIGRHLVRYLSERATRSGAPTPVEAGADLLGPEFDIESGRIEAMEDGEPPS